MRLGPEGCLALGCALLAVTLAAPVSAQTPQIGLLAWSGCDVPLLLHGLEELGYRPGKTIVIECRSANRSYDGLANAAAELVGSLSSRSTSRRRRRSALSCRLRSCCVPTR